jgi:hypothetical protein
MASAYYGGRLSPGKTRFGTTASPTVRWAARRVGGKRPAGGNFRVVGDDYGSEHREPVLEVVGRPG